MTEHIVVVDSGSSLMPKVFALRHAVFVVEQAVPVELEIDEYDAEAKHLVALRGDSEVVGTLRIVATDGMAKIGRLAVQADARRKGIGERLMQTAHAVARESRFDEIFLYAQVTATNFYVRLGYRAEGDVFDDAGIPHICMRKRFAGPGSQ